ncbi:MAG: class I SAM-dependent methyltransferase [Paludibacteraceae bacterium]|nr:class I SAM-dependent methyltransferase [Paludibacteraceae bacterium]
MSAQDVLYRVFSYVRHRLTAWNTTGEGIHSPYLFYIVRFLMHDKNTYYCFEDIERRRNTLLQNDEVLDVVDFGSAGSSTGKHVARRVRDIARSHLEIPAVGQLLFRLVSYMGQEQHNPLEILELGTSLGVTTAYLAKANEQNHLTTLEGSEAVAQVAKQQWQQLEICNIDCRVGRIENTLPPICEKKQFDLVYVDANHTYQATMKYAELLLPRMKEKGILVMDDIHYSREMERAWRELKNDPRVTTSMDLWHVGLLFVDKHYLKRHYRISI